ncbi:MAG: SGNH/GDSL hydrolase family protein [Deltaproteobacteria bacterium]|nr:SGNH/GDSL hydrolase family protein [Deltaproteobacteria bacterium]
MAAGVVMALVYGLAAQPALAAPTVRIISVGDSFASGEGAPDATRRQCLWGPLGFLCKISGEWRANDGDPWGASDTQCDRSGKAGPLQAARSFRDDNRWRFTTEARSLACSGAKIEHLISTPQGGVREQLEQVQDRYGHQRIDALLVSIGGNDVGFASALTYCMTSPLGDCFDDLPFRGSFHETPLGVIGSPAAREAELTDRYQQLRDWIAVNLPNVANVFVTEYPAPTADESGAFCDHAPAGDLLLRGVSASEARWASQVAIATLNRVVADAARRFAPDGWQLVSGLEAAFARHGYCARDDGAGQRRRWINTTVDALDGQGNLSGSLHPNDLGQAAYRDHIRAALQTLLPPPRPQLLARGQLNELAQQVALDAQSITVAWRTAGADLYQVAFRAAGNAPGQLGRPGPAEPGSDVLADPPRFRDPRWQYVTPVLDQAARVSVRGSFDFAVRACTPAACSPWSNVVNLSNLPGPVKLRRRALFGGRVAGDAR